MYYLDDRVGQTCKALVPETSVPFVRAGKCNCMVKLCAALAFIEACNSFNAELSESL